MTRLSIAVSTPRFHPEVLGGAELLAFWLTQRLAGAGHGVDVYTTTALDSATWKPALPKGIEQVAQNLRVRRHPVDPQDFDQRLQLEKLMRAGRQLSLADEEAWLRNGVASRSLEADLLANAGRYDLVIGLPYLVGTTYFAFRAAPERFCLIPCLHDEVFAHCRFTRRMLREAWGLMFNAEPERELARAIEPELAHSEVVGLGWDPAGPGDPELFRARYGIEAPFIVYVGRLELDKNVPRLLEFFVRYKSRRPGDLTLVLAGGGDVKPPARPDIRRLDLDWSDRDAMLRAAAALVQPSVKESLSIVMMQAWLCGRPVLADAAGAVPRYQCARSGGGLWYGSYPEFEAMLDRLLEDPGLAGALGRQGRRFVETELSWPAVLDRFTAAVARWSEAAG